MNPRRGVYFLAANARRQVANRTGSSFGPHTVVEVLSQANTAGEIRRKIQDYFKAGVFLIWVIDPVSRTATVHSSVDHATILDRSQLLEGGAVLPGFRLSLDELFSKMDRQIGSDP